MVYASDFNNLPVQEVYHTQKYYEKPIVEYASLESVYGLSLNKARKENIRLQFDGGNLKLLFCFYTCSSVLCSCIDALRLFELQPDPTPSNTKVLLGVGSLDFI